MSGTGAKLTEGALKLGRALGILANPKSPAAMKQAETYVQNAMKNKLSVIALMEVIQKAPDAAVRQLAAVLLKKKVNRHLKSFPPARVKEYRKGLLATLQRERDRDVRRALAMVVATVAKTQVGEDGKGWNELLAFLGACMKDPSHRETVMFLLELLVEVIGIYWSAFLDKFAAMLASGLADANEKVHLAALSATAVNIEFTSEDPMVLKLTKPLLRPMFVSLRRVAAGELKAPEKVLEQSLQCVADMCSSAIIRLEGKGLDSLIKVLSIMCKKSELSSRVRVNAVLALLPIVLHKQKAVRELDRVPSLLGLCLDLMRTCKTDEQVREEESEGDGEGGESGDKDALPEAADLLLGKLVTSFPSKDIYRPLRMAVNKLLTNITAPPHSIMTKMAVLTALSTASEGCVEQLVDECGKHRGRNWPLLDKVIALSRPSELPCVRRKAFVCMGHWAEYMSSNISSQYGEQIMKAVFSCVATKGPQITEGRVILEARVFVVECLCECLEPAHMQSSAADPAKKKAEQAKKWQMVMRTCVNVANTFMKQSSLTLIEMGVCLLAALVTAAKETFPDFQNVFLQMKRIIMMPDKPEIEVVKSRAVECLGQIVLATRAKRLPLDMVTGMLTKFMKDVASNKSDTFSECAFTFFSNTVKAYGAATPLVPALANLTLKTLAASDECEKQFEAKALGPLADLSDDEDEDTNPYQYRVRSEAVDKRTAACACVSSMAEHGAAAFARCTGPNGVPAVKVAIATLEKNCLTYHAESVRQNAIEAYLNCGLVLYEAARADKAGAAFKWTKGMPGPTRVPDKFAADVSRVVGLAVALLEAEDDVETVARNCEGLTKVLSAFGPDALLSAATGKAFLGAQSRLAKTKPQRYPALVALVTFIKVAFNEKAPCQTFDAVDGEEALEGCDNDKMLFDVLTDLLTALVKACGPAFSDIFQKQLQVPLYRWLHPRRPSKDREVAIGCIAEIVGNLKLNQAWWQHMMRPIPAMLSRESSVPMRCNASYCMGRLLEFGPGTPSKEDWQVIAKQLVHARLLPLLDRGARQPHEAQEAFDGMVDNVAACIARLISKYGRILTGDNTEWSRWFQEHVMPKFLSALPIRADQQEKATVYKAFVDLAAQCAADERLRAVQWVLSEVFKRQRAMFPPIRDVMRKAFQSKPKAWAQIAPHIPK